MTVLDELSSRNAQFAARDFDPGLVLNPSLKTMIIGCVDPRVDPTWLLGLKQGETAVIRNVGGRITPPTLKTLAMLGAVSKANGVAPGVGWNLIVLHHTDCGMTDLAAFPALLAEYFEIPADRLAGKAVSDPQESVRVDVQVLRDSGLPGAFLLSGLVYDVGSGLIETVVAPAPLGGGASA